MANIYKLITKIINFIIFFKNGVSIGDKIRINGILFIKNKGVIIIGRNVKFNSGKRHNPIGGDTNSKLITRKGAKIFIGDNVGISNSTIYSMTEIVIENNVYVGGGCKIWDTDFHSIDPYERLINGDKSVESQPIKICEGAFIGGSSIILKGVTIGKNSVVGAGSVVTKSIPPNQIWAGNPARYIKLIN